MITLTSIKIINKTVDCEDFLKLAKEAADCASVSKINPTQIRSIQNVVNSTQRFSEVLNFIKSQTGRHKEWKQLGPKLVAVMEKIDKLSDGILQEIEKKLKEKKESQAKEEIPAKGEIRLALCRHWVKIFVAEFLYTNPKKEN